MATQRFAFQTKAVLLVVAVAIAATPLLLDDFIVHRLTMALIWAIAIIGLNLLTGYTGQFSIGHAAFCAIGAYATAVFMADFGWPVPFALIAGASVSGGLGFLFGWPALRLGPVQMALVTWGLVLAVPQVLKHRLLEPWTGGVQGLYIDRPAPAAWLPLGEDKLWYVIVAGVFCAGAILARNLVRGRIGRALQAMRDDELAALPMGINVPLLKTTIFGISTAYAGLAGGLALLLRDFIAPDSYGVFFSILLLVGAVAGGVESFLGAAFGGLLIEFLPDLARGAGAALSLPVYGVLLIALVYLMPRGLGPLATALLRRISAFAASPSKDR